jgi:hypothetical protein
MKHRADPVSSPRTLRAALALSLVLGVGAALAASPLPLSGAQETPPVSTTAAGVSTIVIKEDKSVSGSVTTAGITGTIAHIHVGALGQSGPPIVVLTKTADNIWSVPPGTTLTNEQYASYKAGNLYVNVHSADHKSGEIRAQLKP